MQKTIPSIVLSAAVLAALSGCGSGSNSGSVKRVSVPDQPELQSPRVGKPMPAPTRDDVPPPPFDDVALVSQQAPETPEFVKAYNAVGRPPICVFVNRTLQGEIIPVNPNDPLAKVENTRSSNAGVTVEKKDTQTSDGIYHGDRREQTDRFESKGPAQYKETTAVYLRPGQYDELAAKSLDYEAVENILTDFLSADGQVAIISPTLARQKLTDQQEKDLESGKLVVNSELVKQLGAAILVQVTAHPTRQTQQGLQVRLVGEAMNIRDGQSIGRVVVDVPPPLEKTQINKFTRYCARKLMRDMTMTWSAPPMTPGGPPPVQPTERPAPPTVAPPRVEQPSSGPTSMPSKME